MWARCPESHRWLWSRGSHAAKYLFLDGIQSLSTPGVLSSALSFSYVQDRCIVYKAHIPGSVHSSTQGLEDQVDPISPVYWSSKLSVCVHVCLHVSVCVHMYVAAILLASFWSCLTTFPVVQTGWAQRSSFPSTVTILFTVSRVFFVCVTVHCHAVSLYVSRPLQCNTAPSSRSHSNRKLSREISLMQQRGLCLSYLELCVSKMSLDTKDLLIPIITKSSNHNSRFMEIQKKKQHNGVSRPPW